MISFAVMINRALFASLAGTSPEFFRDALIQLSILTAILK